MQSLPQSLLAFAEYDQFLLFRVTWDPSKGLAGDWRKMPISPHTMRPYPSGGDWQKNPDSTVNAARAMQLAQEAGAEYHLGFVIKPNDPFFFFDIDDCYDRGLTAWSDRALDLCSRFAGCAVEVSYSGEGLHIFGSGSPTLPPAERNKKFGKEFDLYTEWRCVLLTGTNVTGDAGHAPPQVALDGVVNEFLLKSGNAGSDEWTTEPCEAWKGPEYDADLLKLMLNSKSAASIFGGKSSIVALWHADADELGKHYPDDHGRNAYDASSADAALAQHLAFWTGNNCERIERLMWGSELSRDKWHREDYLDRTIRRAVSLQETVCGEMSKLAKAGLRAAEHFDMPDLKGRSPKQIEYATRVRAEKLGKLKPGEGDKATLLTTGSPANASFWLDHADEGIDKLVEVVTPIESIPTLPTEPTLAVGHQFMGATLQMEHFAGCCYIESIDKALTPSGGFLKQSQFKATYGGYDFQVDESAQKTTDDAWKAFTQSKLVRWPQAHLPCFRPQLPAGAMLEEEGRTLVNTYVPVDTKTMDGDISPFTTHLEKTLPVQRDREILLAYMAACIQHVGVKFQWAPLLQGTEGNGKTLFTRCVAYAVGRRYTHWPKADKLNNQFNAWMIGNVFYGVEDIYVPHEKRDILEALKPMITGGDGLEIEGKNENQISADICGNFIFNSNHTDAIRTSKNSRRFAIFFTAQQSLEDIETCGMGGQYFFEIYKWLNADGYAIVNKFLREYAIPDELNPATHCQRAPKTSSTNEAVTASLGGVEQEILEAVDEGRLGFAGGWISSMALERLLKDMRADRAIPPNKRRDLLKQLGYDYHPSLKAGRVNNIISSDGGKPRLFIKEGHISRGLQGAAEVARAYQDAQGGIDSPAGTAEEIFNK